MTHTLARLFKLSLLVLRYVALSHIAHRRKDAKHQQLMRQFCADMAHTLGLELQFSGQLSERPCLLTPNHISWHDVFAVGIKAAPHFVAKAEVANWPVFGYLGKQGDTLFIDRGCRNAAKAIADQMAERLHNRSVLFFPEGTTHAGDKVGRFKRRLFEPAIRLQTPIQAVAIHYYGTDYQGQPLGYGDESFAAHLWRTLRTRKIKIGIHFCEPFYPADIEARGNHAQALAEEAQGRVEAAKAMLAARDGECEQTTE